MSQINSATATVTNDTFTFQQENKILESVVTDGLNTTVEYSSVFDSTDLRYDLISNRLKESIIINSNDVPNDGYRKKPYSFTFSDIIAVQHQVKERYTPAERIVVKTKSGRKVIVEHSEAGYNYI